MKLAWVTDIHLNFLTKEERGEFYQEIINTGSDAVFITGDIAEAPCVADLLVEMADQLEKPIYFVLGNHDYYRGQISEVREKMADFTKKNKYLYWLSSSGPQFLTENRVGGASRLRPPTPPYKRCRIRRFQLNV